MFLNTYNSLPLGNMTSSWLQFPAVFQILNSTVWQILLPLTPKAAANLKNRGGLKLYFIPYIQVQAFPGPSETMQDTR